MSTAEQRGLVFANTLIEAGVPVVRCMPNPGYPGDGRADVTPPKGWHLAEPDPATLDGFQPGQTLAMVTGHGIDVIDIDAKTGATLGDCPLEPRYGLDLTPGGGWHLPVPSTGYGRGVLRFGGKVAGDYLGGTVEGGARGLCYLPGSYRPKYPNARYRTDTVWDVAALLADAPGQDLMDLAAGCGLSKDAKPGVAGGQPGDLAGFFETMPRPTGCMYGRAAVDRILAEAAGVTAGGRHDWGLKAVGRTTELVAAGCASAADLEQVRARFRAIKPEAPRQEFTDLLLWAVNNTAPGTPPCDHLPPSVSVAGAARVGVDWEPVDLSKVLASEPDHPALLQRTDGPALLYPGLVHSVAGESESFKSGLLLWEAARLAGDGRPVLYLDFESDARSIGHRLVRFGCDPDELKSLVYIRPSSGFTQEKIEPYLHAAYDLVVIDGVTEFLSLSGGDTNSGDAVARLYQQLPHQMADRTGAAVVLIDHVSKNPERGRFPIGSQHKLAALSGAGYLVQPRTALAPGQTGEVALEVVKDRPGEVRAVSSTPEPGSRVQLAAVITVDSTGDRTVLTIDPPAGGRAGAPPHLLAAISGWVGRQARPVPDSELRLVFPKVDGLDLIIDVLTRHGYLAEQVSGHGFRSYKWERSYLVGVDQAIS